MSSEQILNLLSSTLRQDEVVSFKDESTAESFRMHIYRLKRKWKREGDVKYGMFEEVVIKKDKQDMKTLIFTTRNRTFDSALTRFSQQEQIEGLGINAALTFPPPGLTYEQVNQKAIAYRMGAGDPLTEEEEEILKRGA